MQHNNVDKDYQSPSHADSYLMHYETPVEYKKQNRQCTFNVSHMLKSKSGFRCAVIGHMIKKLLKSPITKGTMLRILRLHKCSEKSDDFNLTRLLLNIRKYRLQKNIERLKKSVKEMRQKFSIWGAAKKLNMNYSELHHILTQCKDSGRNVSELNKKNALEFYASHRITLSLPFKNMQRICIMVIMVNVMCCI